MKTSVLAPTTSVPHASFRLLLQAELAQRCHANPQYSLRAFARLLRIDHATLSQLLRGRRRLTAAVIRRLGAQLGLESGDVDSYVQAESVRLAEDDATLIEAGQLTHDAANVITQRHHAAILEVVHLHGFQADSRWIARVLGLGVDEVNVAITRLLHLNMLRMDGPDRWVDQTGHAVASLEQVTAAVLRRLHEHALRQSLDARFGPTRDQSMHLSSTFAMNSARLPEVHAAIARFRRELASLISRDNQHNDVFQLDLSFFPLTTLQRREGD